MKAGLFATCLVDQFFPQVAWSTLRLLEMCGVSVEFDPGQTCCGQPAYNSGCHADAKQVSARLFNLYADADYIVVPSGSCAAMMRRHLYELHGADHAGLNSFAERVVELTDFLTRVCGRDDFGARFRGKAAYHDSCHALRDLGIHAAPRRLLTHVRELELVSLPEQDQCCGFGGLFSVRYPEISASMGKDKIENLVRLGVDLVVSSDSGCLMHLGGMLRRQGVPIRALHVAEVLAGPKPQ
jgi:L-lactate dehydrogenase complex protein LldE